MNKNPSDGNSSNQESDAEPSAGISPLRTVDRNLLYGVTDLSSTISTTTNKDETFDELVFVGESSLDEISL